MLKSLSHIDRNDIRGRLFIGTVVVNNDPNQLERIKVTIPKLFETSDPGQLPWVGRRDGGPIATAAGHGSFGLVPRIGDKVWVEFQDGNPLFGLYWHAPILNGLRVPEANVNYPNRYGWKDPAGNLFMVDTTSGQNTITIQHAAGTTIRINNDGSIDLVAAGVINSSAPEWNHTGPINVEGLVTVSVDVIAGSNDVSLVNHVHGGVDSGPNNTSPPL